MRQQSNFVDADYLLATLCEGENLASTYCLQPSQLSSLSLRLLTRVQKDMLALKLLQTFLSLRKLILAFISLLVGLAFPLL